MIKPFLEFFTLMTLAFCLFGLSLCALMVIRILRNRKK